MHAPVLIAAVLLATWGETAVSADTPLPVPPLWLDTLQQEYALVPDPAELNPAEDSTARISITGLRLTQGNAVDCPQIRDEAGVVHSVSYLSPAVSIGERVTVSGTYGIITTCRGTVLVVEVESSPAD